MEVATNRVAVTGATGFLGRHVVCALVKRGLPVRAVIRRRGRENVLGNGGVEVRYADVLALDSWKEALDGVDALVHLVAIIREAGPATFEAVNHAGTAQVVVAAQEAGVERIVHVSAIGARDDPQYPYLQSKWLGEQVVTGSGIPYTVLRGSILFGEGDEFINTLAGVVRASPLIPVAGDGRTRFQPLHIKDMARCIVEALKRDDLKGQSIEVGGPEHMTYDEIIGAIARTIGRRRGKGHVPLPVMRALVSVMEKTLPHPPATRQQLGMLAFDNIGEMDTVERVFGFTPRPLRGNIEYIRRTSFWEGVRMSAGFMPRRFRDQ